ncbi:hypothetical protein [Nitrobacter sp.]|uniref:hypothetical protein n=1 Tax=Nitrobacter sp. TaxID=29420 RepID=UPI003F64F7FC
MSFDFEDWKKRIARAKASGELVTDIDFARWLKLSDALQRAKDTLGDWTLAGRAIAFNLETSRLRAICEDFEGWGAEEELAISFKWGVVDPTFWLGSLIDWGSDHASVGRDGTCFRISGIMVHKDDLDAILRPKKGDSSDATSHTPPAALASGVAITKAATQLASIDLTDSGLQEAICRELNIKSIPRSQWREIKAALKKNPDVAPRLRSRGENARVIRGKNICR